MERRQNWSKEFNANIDATDPKQIKHFNNKGKEKKNIAKQSSNAIPVCVLRILLKID